jgi:hypothetical protein
MNGIPMCDTFFIHAHQEGPSAHNSVLLHNMCHKGCEPNLPNIDEVRMYLPRILLQSRKEPHAQKLIQYL